MREFGPRSQRRLERERKRLFKMLVGANVKYHSIQSESDWTWLVLDVWMFTIWEMSWHTMLG